MQGEHFMSEFMNFVLISVFLSFPETIIVILLGLSLCNIKIEMRKVTLIAALQAIVALLVRYANLSFGIHTLVQVSMFCIFVAVILKISLYKSVVPVLIGTFIEFVLSFAIISGIDAIYEINYAPLNVEFIPTLILWLPVKITELILIFVVRKTKFTLCNIGEEVEILGK